MIKSIGWAANQYGYVVQGHDEHGQVTDELDYWAGNNVHDSQSYVDPGTRNAVSPEELRRMAEKTAKEAADEHNVSHDDVWEDTDMAAQLKEVYEGCS